MLEQLPEPISLICHQNADFDAITSLYLLEEWLKKKKKKQITLHCKTGLPKQIPSFSNTRISKSPPKGRSLITVDCRAIERTGFELKKIDINFDHHEGNTQFGNLNIVDRKAVSTTELLWKLIPKSLQNPLICKLSLIGILSDSQNLQTPNTKSTTFKTVAKILKTSKQLQNAHQILKPKLKSKELKQLGEILSQSEINQKQIGFVYLNQKYPKNIRNLAIQHLNQLQNIKATCLLQNEEGRIQGSLRSQTIDVNKISQLFNGGGHKKAAGFETQI